MLFDPRNNVDLFAALGGISLLLVLVLPPAVAELGPERRALGLLLCAAVALPAITNLLRYRVAKLGCVILPLSVLLCGAAWAAGRPFVERALLLGAPNAVFFVWDVGIRRLLAWRVAQVGLVRVAAAVEPHEVGPYLLAASSAVRSAAVGRLRGFEPRQVVPLLADPLRSSEPGPRASALELLEPLVAGGTEVVRGRLVELLGGIVQDGAPAAAGDAAHGLGIVTAADGDHLRRVLADEDRPEVLIGLARGFRSGPPGQVAEGVVEAALRVAGNPVAEDAEREAAVEALGLSEETPADDPLARAAAAAVAARLRSGEEEPTPELLWLLVDHGQADHASLAAQRVAYGDYGVAHAAVEAVEGICRRHEDDLGPAAGPVREALTAGRDALREAHPPRDNPLADGLVERIEGLLGALAA